MIKNPTPQQIALLCAFFISGILLVLLLVFQAFYTVDGSILSTILLVLVVFISAYVVIIYYLKKYIYRKIKLIYKTIHKKKLSPEEKNQVVDVSKDIIEEVEKEVQEWADLQEKEIQKLKTWQDYRRKFLGDISHELKTPIFNIQGYIETLIDGGLEDYSINKTYLQRAAVNVDRLNTIIEDLESISRLESGTLILDVQSFDLYDLTNEVFEDLEIKADRKKVRLIFKPGADGHFKVRADRETIRQVLMNLVNNSIKYGRKGGVTKVGFYDMDNNILIEVADNGIGIPSKHINHVFDRFYRVDKHRSREQGGSGLGLSIVKHIIEAHKQTINVRSSDGLGSTFGFTLEKA